MGKSGKQFKDKNWRKSSSKGKIPQAEMEQANWNVLSKFAKDNNMNTSVFGKMPVKEELQQQEEQQ